MSRTACGYASLASTNKESQLQDQMPSFFLSETVKYLYLLFDETNFIHHRPYIFSTEAHPFETTQLHSLREQQRLRNASALERVRREAAAAAFKGRSQSLAGGQLASAAGRRRVKGARRVLGSARASSLTSSGSLVAQKWLQVVDLQKEHQRQDEARRQRQWKLQQQQQQQRRSDQEALLGRSDGAAQSLLPTKCLKRRLWGEPAAYQPDLIVPLGRSPAKKAAAVAVPNRRHFVLHLLAHIYSRVKKARVPSESGTAGTYFVRGVRSDVCKAADRPAKRAIAAVKAKDPGSAGRPSGTGTPAESAVPEPGLLRTVEVNMGPLGDFEVKVFPDGFAVLSRQDRSLVEISNVGKSVVLVRDSLGSPSQKQQQPRSKAVVATTAGLVRTCSVQAVSAQGDVLLDR